MTFAELINLIANALRDGDQRTLDDLHDRLHFDLLLVEEEKGALLNMIDAATEALER